MAKVTDIDVVITYVNPSDPNWGKSYSKATGNYNVNGPRFRSWGTLKYLLRGISEYMTFIREVILIVSDKSQVPVWIDKDKVRIVYHNEFIPNEFLPTFNSCTIESFFWNISDLADKIIYFNDDMFAINSLNEDDFFTENVPHLYFEHFEGYSKKNIFRCQCRTGIDMITTSLNLSPFNTGEIIKPQHSVVPITKESLLQVAKLCGDKINKSVSILRKPSNVNQYIYSYYQYFTNNYICDFPKHEYFEIKESTIEEIKNAILSKDCQLLCINDSDRLNDYKKLSRELQKCFELKFPNKCKYECDG